MVGIKAPPPQGYDPQGAVEKAWIAEIQVRSQQEISKNNIPPTQDHPATESNLRPERNPKQQLQPPPTKTGPYVVQTIQHPPPRLQQKAAPPGQTPKTPPVKYPPVKQPGPTSAQLPKRGKQPPGQPHTTSEPPASPQTTQGGGMRTSPLVPATPQVPPPKQNKLVALPTGWTVYWCSRHNAPYYHNHAIGETTWIRPTDTPHCPPAGEPRKASTSSKPNSTNDEPNTCS